jgi:heavy metal sensor kinase
VAGLYHVLHTQAKNDMTMSVNNLTRYLAEGNQVDQQLLKEHVIVPGVILKVLDKQENLVLDNSPDIPGNSDIITETADQAPLAISLLKSNMLRIVHIDRTYYYYVTQWVQQGDNTYQLQLMKALSEQTHFLQTLTKILVATNAIGLIISILSGIFISRRILRPLRNITSTAHEIEITDLGKRIPVSNSGDELDELAETFNHMLTRLQTGFEQQRQFVSDASHELRTPITVISGYVNMLDRWGKQDLAALEEGLSAIKSEAVNMDALIEKLLFLARADQGAQLISKARMELAPLIETIIHETSMIAPNHRVILDQNDPVIVDADSAALKQMMRIFIENSIKYTPPGGTISIASCQIGQHLEITIQDSGIGIPKKDQSRVFDRFYRVDRSRSKSTGGTGLGLSIARWIAEQHGIILRLNSTPGKGTTVTLRLPLKSTAEKSGE